MSYVEFLRARRAFIILASILTIVVLGVTLLAASGIHTSGIGTRAADGHVPEQSVRISLGGGDEVKTATTLHDLDFTFPLGMLFGLAGYVAIIMATILGTSLNKENGFGGFAFTKPVSRERLALLYFAVDAGAIVATFLFAVLLGILCLTVLGILDKLVFEPGAFTIAGIGLGAAAMWYGLLQVATSFGRFRGQVLSGVGWGAFLILLPFGAVTDLGPGFHNAMLALNYLNPLAYYTGLEMHDSSIVDSSLLGLSEPLRLAITWGVGIVACALAVAGWKRVEV